MCIMLAQLSRWLLIAAIGQAPPEAALAKAAPADVDVAVRVRGMETSRDDLLAMLKAMNPDWATAAEGPLSAPVAEMRQRHGEHAAKSPFLALVKFGDDGAAGGPPPFAVLVHSEDYKSTLKELSGGKDVELKHQEGDYDEFDSPGGDGKWYAAKAPGVVGFGPSKELIAAIAKRPGQSLDSVLTGSAGPSFYRGDVGLFVNAASLSKRFGEQIEQGRQMLMAALDQAAQQQGNATAMEMVKGIYGKLFDSLKVADRLTLGLDAGPKGLHLAGFLKIKTDSASARSIADVRSGDLPAVGKLPTGSMSYGSMNVSATAVERFQSMNLRMLGAGGKPSPESEKAVAEFHGLGQIEQITAMSMDKGMTGLSEMRVDDPRKYITAAVNLVRSMGEGAGRSGIYKDLKVEENARTDGGLTYTHVSATMDVHKLAELAGNQPAQVENLKTMFGDGQVGFWYGTDGKRVLQVIAPTWDEAKSLIDRYSTGKSSVGEDANFKAVRSELPEQASVLLVFNAQGLVRMMVRSIGAVTKRPDLKAPEDMPKDPAYLGVSLTPHAAQGYEFHLAIPSTVGIVIAKGFVPMIGGLAPPGANQ
jgi:hypothetical protein